MTKGELFKIQFDVAPCAGGSFIVRSPTAEGGRYETYAFSNLADLLAWFHHHGQQQQQPSTDNLKDRLKANQAARAADGGKPVPLPGSPVEKKRWLQSW